MKLSIKKLAVAVALAATAASASAAIDNGAGGNGELFFNIWDSNGSYSLDLNVSINDFTTLLSTGTFDLTYSLAADSNFTSFLASANTSSLLWNVQATDTSGARRMFESYSVMPAETITSDLARTAAGMVRNLASNVNSEMATDANSVFVSSSSEAYAGQAAAGDTLDQSINFSNGGTLANNSYESGLNLMRIDAKATGILPTTYTQLYAGANEVSLYIDADNALHIAAAPVPEPESYAMLLAGLGMVGFMARRRLGKRA